MKDNLGLKGCIDITIKRANGDIEKRHIENTIHSELKNFVAYNFQAAEDIALDNLYAVNATTPEIGKDGIIIHKSTGAWYSMISSVSGSDNSRKITGTFTGVAGTFDDVCLGHVYVSADNFSLNYADPTSWDNVVLAAADTLTVEWTITVGE